MQKIRSVLFYKNNFETFYENQAPRIKHKIDEVLFFLTIMDRIPSKFLKHLEGTNGLYEIRVEQGSNIFRIFCCFDEGKLIVLFNGFQKKSQKTPKAELDKAEKLKSEYFEEKRRAYEK